MLLLCYLNRSVFRRKFALSYVKDCPVQILIRVYALWLREEIVEYFLACSNQFAMK